MGSSPMDRFALPDESEYDIEVLTDQAIDAFNVRSIIMDFVTGEHSMYDAKTEFEDVLKNIKKSVEDRIAAITGNYYDGGVQ